MGQKVILRQAGTYAITFTKVVLCLDVALLNSQSEPPYRFRIIVDDSLTSGVEPGKSVLGLGIALNGC